MLSMSKEFYNYISDKLINFFIENEINAGNKYFIEFDKENQVKELYDSLKECSKKYVDVTEELFTYPSENGLDYKTYSLNIGDKYKVVVADSSSVTVDYLVTLRNAVTDQEDVWENTVLMVICFESIDSIEKGMKNLQKEGMPLNFKTISGNLTSELNSSKLSKVEKQIIKFDLDQKSDDFDSTLWDYEHTLGMINKGEITSDDLKYLQLFPDKGLDNKFRSSKIRKRLEDNHKDFVDIRNDHQYDNVEDRLNKRFNDKGTSKLKSDYWEDVDYTDVIKFKDKDNLNIEYCPAKNKLTDEGLIYWDKPNKESGAGFRKRNIIIFNNELYDKVKFSLNFSKVVLKDSILKKSQKYCKKSGKSLLVELPVQMSKVSFFKIDYMHKGIQKFKFEFNIAIVNVEDSFLESIKSCYKINLSKHLITIIDDDSMDQFSFGTGDNLINREINVSGEDIMMSMGDNLVIDKQSPVLLLEDSVKFNISLEDYKIPFIIEDAVNRPDKIDPLRIWDLKRKNQESFLYNGVKIVQDVNGYYVTEDVKKILSFEEQIISNKMFHGEINVDDSITNIPLNLSEDVSKSYGLILDYFNEFSIFKKGLGYPSLSYVDEKLEKLYENFLNIYNEEISEIPENVVLSELENKLDLYKIGVFKSNNEVFFSALSPINIAYQLEIKKQLGDENVPASVLRRLNNENLVPYIYNDNILYKPSTNSPSKEWLKYEKDENVSIGSTNSFISKVIDEKLNQFISNFSYLFFGEANAPIKINVINIKQDKEIVKGVFNFLYKRINKSQEIIPIELNIYNEGEGSYFDKFFDCKNEDEFKKFFDISITSRKMVPIDILELIQDSITYYKHSNASNYDYAHISFYKIGNNASVANNDMDKIESGLSLDGLLSESTAFNTAGGYRIGFGAKDILDENLLIKTAINYNELMQNSYNDGENAYSKRKTIIAKPVAPEEEDIEKLYQRSMWVTFVEPSFGLEYFDNKDNLIIIHYSDQYTSSKKYDTITVTNKNKQYESIIEKFLKEKDIEINNSDMKDVISLFNGINGEWLLRIVSDYSVISREKLSIISALKYSLALLDHPEIIWIPISMDEILRVAGTIGLNKDDAIFSKKILTGEFSDDLLFVGIHVIDDKINIYYYPVEVKEGIVPSSTKIKAENQLSKTYELILNQLVKYDYKFRNKFNRNFFMQIALANMQKLKYSRFWSDDQMQLVNNIKPKLLNDQYNVSIGLEKFIKKGAVFAFKRDEPYSSLKFDDDFQIITMPAEYAYVGITNDVFKMKQEFQNDGTDIISSDLLFNKILKDISFEDSGVPLESESFEIENDDVDSVVETGGNNSQSTNKDEHNDSNKVTETRVIGNLILDKLGNVIGFTGSSSTSDVVDGSDEGSVDVVDGSDEGSDFVELVPVRDIRAMKGTIKGSNKKLYWEYGKAGNRHIFVSGKSGSGKTYFLQCLIYEMSKQQVPTLIIDYSNSFTLKELKKPLVDYLGDDLIYYDVKFDGFPLNPFRLFKQEDSSGNMRDESYGDVAERVANIFASVYPKLGDVQQPSLTEAIMDCLEEKGVDITFKDLKNKLNSGDSSSKKIAARLNSFTIHDPFKNGEFEWDILDSRSGKVFVIQLSTFDDNIQKIITELILWDLWNYKVINGSEDKPFNVVFDEAQNLNFLNNSPSMKILQQGRKHGWSAWFATVSVENIAKKSSFNPLNQPEEVVFFYPADNSKTILSNFPATIDKMEWEERLAGLRKKECICLSKLDVGENELAPTRPFLIKVDSLEERLSR